ncbi:MAG: glycoside hydrolase family 3 N-terminal domain-containing protein [Proteiniphilum sp.]|nr:glycoside hydrolase family 3 N-terminal domain-containing protein [Proteiniphilum sp.]MDD4416421.1 glycoside hydrolase family 3 N-terminal domain-containing protein [Proteiniphilum sp.]
MKKTLIIYIFFLSSMLLKSQVVTTLYKQAHDRDPSQWVDSVYAEMTQDEKIGQLFMPIAEPNNGWKSRISGYIRNQKVGGLLFSKGTLAQQAEITNYAQGLSSLPLMIALDGEWGLSMRLSDAPKYPRNLVIGAIQDEEVLKLYGKEIARQCKEMGIHVNFAPSIDVHSNPMNPVIGSRSYGENPQNVAKQGIAYAKGMEENGVMAVAKHFPGHGDTLDDSHKKLPTVNHDQERLEQVELYPFREYVNAGLSGIMLGHLNVPVLKTNGKPASLSPEIGINLLKDDMGFTGLTFTDGMSMKSVSNQLNASVKALLAGNDIILGVANQGNEFESVKKAVNNGTIPASLVEEKVKKILTYKYILGAHEFTPINTSDIKRRVNSPTAKWVQRKIYDGAVTLVKNDDELIPLKGLDKVKIASIAIGADSSNTFQRYLKKYGDIATFQTKSSTAVPLGRDGSNNKVASAQAEPTALPGIDQLNEYDLVIVSVHMNSAQDTTITQQLAKCKKTVLVLFTSPYMLSNFQTHTNNASSVIMAYDETEFAQMSAAQAIFGGIAMTGKLPVTSGSFKEGTGINTNKTRLSYSMPEEVGIPSERLARIESIALEGIRQKAYPGCQILVAKDGVVIYEKEFGKYDYGNGPAVTDETVYDLASVTKATATLPAIMKLYDEKKIRLLDPISKFVPKTKGSDKSKASIRSLLLHESGITSFIPYYTTAIDESSYSGPLFGRRSSIYNVHYAGAWGRTDYKFIPDFISNKKSHRFHLPIAEEMFGSDKMYDALLKDVIASPLRRRGSYTYSCLNFMLLKEAVENISETDLDTYVKQNFFNKLGATTTTFLPLRYMSVDKITPTENDPFFRKQLLRGYVHDEGAALFGGISGNAGLFSNANDLAKLYQMWLNGGEYGGERFLSRETVKLFTTGRSSISRRGLGFDKPDPQNNNSSPTSPGTPIEVYGHTGFTGTGFWIDPVNNMIYIFLSNRVYPFRTPNRFSSLKIRERIQEELYDAINTDKRQKEN